MNNEIISYIFEFCIIPILAILTRYAVKFFQAKAKELSVKTDNELALKYISMIAKTVEDCVVATNQTYVDNLKAQGKFNTEAQKIAFEKTLNAVLEILNEDAKDYIKETTNDLNIYLTQLIESTVNTKR